MSSVSALHGRPRHAAYAATKAALLGLTTSLAAELAPRVRVNCVAPGATDTPMMAEAITAYLEVMDAEEAQRTGTAEMSRVLLGRVGDPGGTGRRHCPPGARCQLQHRQRCHRRRGLQRPVTRGKEHHQQKEGIMQRARSAAMGRHARRPGCLPRVILIADAAWDAPPRRGPDRRVGRLGYPPARCRAAAARTGARRPGRRVPRCRGPHALCQHRNPGGSLCRLVAPANAAGAIAGIALLITFPAAAHPYVAALAVAGTGCAVFAALEYQAQRPQFAPE